MHPEAISRPAKDPAVRNCARKWFRDQAVSNADCMSAAWGGLLVTVSQSALTWRVAGLGTRVARPGAILAAAQPSAA